MEPIAILHRKLDAGPPLEDAIGAVASRGGAAILDSADTGPGRGRYTILACDPLEVRTAWPGDPDPFESLRSWLARMAVSRAVPTQGSADPPFAGGWIGYFAYEAGHYIEQIAGRPCTDIRLPLARWGLYDSAAIHDAATRTWSLVAADLRPYYPQPRPAEECLARWTDLLAQAAPLTLAPRPRVAGMRENMSADDYICLVRRAREYIAAGDIFQVNLARRLSLKQSEPAVATYQRLRRVNPAAYAAFLAWDEGRSAILSASPELFLDVHGRQVVTRPIKGTRPRSADPVLDASFREALLNSHKDRAELAMIVDLERNDLGRVCEYGSVRVRTGPRTDRGAAHRAPQMADAPARPFAELEAHPTVHHLVATVEGRLRAECDRIDLLRATFPGGSITGAPKVRAMQIIDELEPTQRSVYTGAIGYIGLDTRMQLNIAIRTALIVDGQAHIHVGSGIVADSDPDEEYAETTAKAAGLCAALGIEAPTVQKIS